MMQSALPKRNTLPAAVRAAGLTAAAASVAGGCGEKTGATSESEGPAQGDLVNSRQAIFTHCHMGSCFECCVVTTLLTSYAWEWLPEEDNALEDDWATAACNVAASLPGMSATSHMKHFCRARRTQTISWPVQLDKAT